MSKSHDHNHQHVSERKQPTRRLIWVLILTAGYMLAEIIGGLASNSLSLLADAGHMLADVAGLVISILAFLISARPPNDKATFGYHRAEVIAAFLNGLALIIISIIIIKEAIVRIVSPADINTNTMMLVALGGLIINILGLLILHKDKAHNLNLHGAWLHVLSDTLGSIGVIISGILIYYFGWHIADPIASIIIAVLVSYSSINLILSTLRVLMQHAPEHISSNEVIEEILSLPEAKKIHDLHIWSISSGKEALSMHVLAETGADYNRLLHDIQHVLLSKFGIEHATIQIENICPAPEQNCHKKTLS